MGSRRSVVVGASHQRSSVRATSPRSLGMTRARLELFHGFRVVAMMLDFYVSAFGVLLAALEVKSKICSELVTARIKRWGGFLTTTRGRGLFLLLLALVSLATVRSSVAVQRT